MATFKLWVALAFTFLLNTSHAAPCPKVLVLADGNFLSHTTRPLEIAAVLRNRGVDVQFAIGGRYESIVRERGFETLPLNPSNAEKIEKISQAGFCNWFTPAELRSRIQEDQRLFDRVQPDLVLSD